MSKPMLKVLVIGGTGSIGLLVVAEALRQGHAVRVLVRDPGRARKLPGEAELVVGDLTRPATLAPAVDGVDAIVFTHGSDGGGAAGSEQVDYGGVRNVLMALDGRPVRIALMTTIGVTERQGAYNRSNQSHDWKRRGERLVRASGMPYTIVRPGWFDHNARDQHQLVFLQGDRRHAGGRRRGPAEDCRPGPRARPGRPEAQRRPTARCRRLRGRVRPVTGRPTTTFSEEQK